MLEIPPTKETDAEDVVWGLQTAEALWKRGERIDALVWLRRAAQSAGDANDDDRALELARHAAELTEWMATHASAMPPIHVEDEELDAPAIVVDDEVVLSDIPPRPQRSTQPTFDPDAEVVRVGTPPAPDAAGRARVRTASVAAEGDTEEGEGRPSTASVPPAETVHAGMFDPWADQSAQTAAKLPSPVPVISPEEPEEEVVTSVRPHRLTRPRSDAPPISAGPTSSVPISMDSVPIEAAPARPPPAKPPPLPPRARRDAPKPPRLPSLGTLDPSAPVAPSSPPASMAPGPAVAPPTFGAELAVDDVATATIGAPPLALSVAPISVEDVDTAEPSEESTVDGEGDGAVSAPSPISLRPPASIPPRASRIPEAPSIPASAGQLVLDTVEAFADLPDDARIAFAAAATLHPLAEGEEIGTFALAYVVNGVFDVAATVVDAPAARLSEGAVLRSRGTTDEGVPMRLICAEGQGIVATWSDAAVDEAFRSIPWVEEDLRAAADRVQTLVGITIGPLGERLDVSIREQILSRLTMRPLSPAEIIVRAGEAVPGLLLVGVGELELVKDDEVVGVVGSGEFLFPTEVLGAGSAPATARAGVGGALVMFGDRGIAQELLVTCPPLLEVFAGM